MQNVVCIVDVSIIRLNRYLSLRAGYLSTVVFSVNFSYIVNDFNSVNCNIAVYK